MTAVQTQSVISMDRVIDIKVNRLSSALYDLYTLSALVSDCRFGVSPVNYPDPDPELSHSEPESTYTKHIPVKFSLYQYPLEFNSI